MLTYQKGLNAVKSTFKPFLYDYRLCIFYTSLISRVFIIFHKEKFFIFMQCISRSSHGILYEVVFSSDVNLT